MCLPYCLSFAGKIWKCEEEFKMQQEAAQCSTLFRAAFIAATVGINWYGFTRQDVTNETISDDMLFKGNLQCATASHTKDSENQQ